MAEEGDVLIELTDIQLKQLAAIYGKLRNQLPHLHSFFHICLRSKALGMLDFVHVYSPGGCWQEDGTFIASMPIHSHDIVFHSLDPSGTNLIEGFRKTKKFKFLKDPARDYTYLYGVHEMFCSKILQLFTEDLQHEVSYNHAFHLYRLDMEKALQSEFRVPDEVYITALEPQDLPAVVKAWPFSFPAAEQKLQDCLKLSVGFVVRLKSTDEMVSWVTSSCYVSGQMAALQTAVQHQQKGYAQLAVREFSRYLANNGFDTCGTVVAGNVPCERMLEGLGFEKLLKCRFIAIRNKY
ncbi:uncharacterized protein LOC109542463 isoform X1 [Dendroctonus ponderosae]|uniref:uncharacterized protein LOC109542463 isoform X1 n=1 Tax=Dendroctonus ponderosae TaxID=77166 RepID=UPI0020360F3D|nr:uncharacterized protein LOC109542463 isoform X1 [Dendroctonus ponderosae]